MMKRIKLDCLYQMHTIGHSSKGNQMKVRVGDYWYKADYMGYEGLAEMLVSGMLEKSNLVNFVKYNLIRIECGEKVYNGCCSRNFLTEGENLITIEHLYRQYTGQSLAKKLAEIECVGMRIEWTVKTVEKITQIPDFGKYITAMLELDAFFLNEDRHLNNIAVIYNFEKDCYRTCEYFDHGLALLADLRTDFPLERSLEACMGLVEAKPFSRSFDEQLDAAEELYGQQLYFEFDIKDVLYLLEQCGEMYDKRICGRVEELLRYQIRKYGYFFRDRLC